MLCNFSAQFSAIFFGCHGNRACRDLQQQYEAEQQRIRKTHEDGLRKSQQLDVERLKQVRGHTHHASGFVVSYIIPIMHQAMPCQRSYPSCLMPCRVSQCHFIIFLSPYVSTKFITARDLVECHSSAVECRTFNRESPGSNPLC